MINIFDIFKNIILNESVNTGEIETAIKKRHRVALSYEGDPSHGIATGVRYVDPYSLIETTAGNLAIRGFQPFGDTVTKTPSWKLFRVDKITNWVETPLTFKTPAKGFNPNGDLNANRILLMVQFGEKVNNSFKNNINTPQPNKDINNVNNSLYKTDTEKNMDKLKQQLNNPTYIDNYLPPTQSNSIVNDTENLSDGDDIDNENNNNNDENKN